ncbi:MAG: iron chelate uptake ABC transporter family permease subunit [Helicobacteraceae bacterium]|nr:iron chelate uptake ABC transporter family permease subunit [Helicobacteraceae bacterium]
MEMLEYEFMQRAFIAGIIIAILASVSGSFIVLKRYSMLSETLAHSALVGVSVGIVAGFSPMIAAVFVALVSAWLIEYLRSSFDIYSDAIMAIFLSASLAIAITIISLAGEFNSSIFSYLFGSILSVTTEDVTTIFIFALVALFILALFYREFCFIAFDEDVASTSGVKVKFLNYLLVTIVAIVIALSIRVVGSLLIGALMVIPTVAALQFKKSFALTVLYATIFSILSVIVGMSLSYHFSLPSGATIVLAILVIFILSLVVNRK